MRSMSGGVVELSDSVGVGVARSAAVVDGSFAEDHRQKRMADICRSAALGVIKRDLPFPTTVLEPPRPSLIKKRARRSSARVRRRFERLSVRRACRRHERARAGRPNFGDFCRCPRNVSFAWDEDDVARATRTMSSRSSSSESPRHQRHRRPARASCVDTVPRARTWADRCARSACEQDGERTATPPARRCPARHHRLRPHQHHGRVCHCAGGGERHAPS